MMGIDMFALFDIGSQSNIESHFHISLYHQ